MEQEDEIGESFEIEKKENIFKLDYKGQNINKKKFTKFKMSITKQNNNKGLLYFCQKDNAYFYYNSQYKYNNGICPLCRKDICYFCLKSNALYKDKCCLSKAIHYFLYVYGFRFFKDNDDILIFEDQINKELIIYALIPILNLILLVGGIQKYIYKIEDIIVREKDHIFYDDFEDHLKSNRFGDYYCYIFEIVVALDVGSTIIIMVPFAILNIILTILLIIISIPFKMYPIKYLVGIAYTGWNPYE
jgi:hypothetical protein